MRGNISPKVMAMMIRKAVGLFAAMLVSRAAGALGPIETNSTKPAAALNRKKPGIICKGQMQTIDDRRYDDADRECRLRAPRLRRFLRRLISAQRAAWASMPATIGWTAIHEKPRWLVFLKRASGSDQEAAEEERRLAA